MNIAFIQEQGIFFLRIILACVCGGLIGIERQHRAKVAGTRIHMMIAVATALMMIISKYGFMDIAGTPGTSWDISRIAAGVVSGIGILGGGIIFTGKQGYVSGITTAAGIWATIGIGMALGAGMYVLGIGTTLGILLLQWLLHKKLWIVKEPTRAQVTFHLDNDKQAYEKVFGELKKYDIGMSQFKWERKGPNSFRLKCQVYVPSGLGRDDIVEIFMNMEELETFEWMTSW